MKRKLLVVLLVIISALCLAFGISACGGGTSENGTYYLYKSGSYDYSDYITLKNGEWSDNDGESGTYSVSDGTIIFYYVMFGESEELMDGTISNGIMTLDIAGASYTYCLEGKTPTAAGNSNSSDNNSVQYTVTYNANGGTFEGGDDTYKQTVNSGSTLTAPTSPTRENYTFAGWATSKGGSTMWSFSSDTVTGNITLYASWTEKSASILSVDGASIDGTDIYMLVSQEIDSVSLSSKVVCSSDSTWKLYYDKLGQTEIPTKVAASLSGSLYNGENVFYIVVTSTDGTQVNLYTLTVYRSYAVTIYYYDGDTLIDTDTAYTGFAFTTNYIPSIDGYTFNYWKTSSESKYTEEILWGNLYLYASKTVNTYTVTYDVNGGEELSVATKIVSYDSSYTLSVPERTGYTFNGWYLGSVQLTNSNGKSFDVWNYTSDKTLTAKWTSNNYTVTLNLSDSSAGTVTGGGEHAYDSSVTIIAATTSGYTWVGWYNSNDELVTTSTSYTFTMSFDVTYTAKWTYYTLTTSINNSSAGSVSSYSDTKITAGTSKTLKATTNIGYIFIGWYDHTDNLVTTETDYTFDMPTENLNYTAKYELNEDMSNFIFTSTTSTCKITGIKDDTVTEIIVPDYVTTISDGAFSGCSYLESITLPFVGSSASATSASASTLFGYIFGTSSYMGGTATIQYYASSNYETYYIPSTLTTVTITGRNILYGAFCNCTSLTSINIFDSVISIGDYAFALCRSLESITIPDSVTSIGDFVFYDCEVLTSITLPDSVTSIGSSAFSGCISLESITLPDNVTSIGSSAFGGCTSLESVTLPDSVTSIGNYAFYNCTSLTSLIIGNSVTAIGGSAFRGCTSLTSITIPESVTTINTYAFYNCTALIEINFNATSVSDLSSSNYVFYNAGQSGDGITVTIGVNVKKIPAYLFDPNASTSYSPKMTSVVFEDGCVCTSIGSCAFYNCTLLTSMTILDSVTSIGSNAFYGCYRLVEVYNLSSLTITAGSTSNGYVGYYAKNVYTSESGERHLFTQDDYEFVYDSNGAYYLMGYTGSSTALTLPTLTVNGETISYSIYQYAFYNNTKITSITIGDSITSIGSYAFAYCTAEIIWGNNPTITEIGGYAFAYYAGTSITIPDSVTSIGSSAFGGCSSLVSITLPFVGSSASTTSASSSTLFGYIFGTTSYTGGTSTKQYYASSSYTTYYIPTTLTTVTITGGNILYGAFYGCTKLTSVTIGNGVTSMGNYAFYNCTALIEINFNATAMSNLSSSNYVFYYAGRSGKGITVTIGANVTEIPAYLFYPYYLFTPKITNVVFENDSVCESIGDCAFRDCTSLAGITIPDSVTSIGAYAFYGCTSLESISIPDSVTSIGMDSFSNCTSLTTVYYGGTVSEWNLISIGDGNGYLTTAAIYYFSESEPDYTDGYNYWHYVNGEIVVWTKTTEE